MRHVSTSTSREYYTYYYTRHCLIQIFQKAFCHFIRACLLINVPLDLVEADVFFRNMKGTYRVEEQGLHVRGAEHVCTTVRA